jgi:probable HAF family extracellular repeat protein
VLLELARLGGARSCALALNDCGQVVGWAETASDAHHAALWCDGEVQDLGALPGTSHSEAWDINDDGVVVGVSSDPAQGLDRALVWQAGTMEDLGSLSGAGESASASGRLHRGRFLPRP